MILWQVDSKFRVSLNSVSPSSMQPIRNTSQQNEKSWINKAISVYRRVGLDGWKLHTKFGEIPETSFRAFLIWIFSNFWKSARTWIPVSSIQDSPEWFLVSKKVMVQNFRSFEFPKKWATTFGNFFGSKKSKNRRKRKFRRIFEGESNFRRLTKSQSLNLKKSL